eukprot:tig00021464_g21730.t1
MQQIEGALAELECVVDLVLQQAQGALASEYVALADRRRVCGLLDDVSRLLDDNATLKSATLHDTAYSEAVSSRVKEYEILANSSHLRAHVASQVYRALTGRLHRPDRDLHVCPARAQSTSTAISQSSSGGSISGAADLPEQEPAPESPAAPSTPKEATPVSAELPAAEIRETDVTWPTGLSEPLDQAVRAGRLLLLTEGDRRVFLLGSMHISHESAEEARRLIMEVRPEAVATELCPTRWAALEESADAAKNWRSLAKELVRKKQRERLALGWYLIDSADQMVIQQIEFWRQHERNGFQEGVEALAVGEAAARVGAQVVLIDRPYEITQLRKELAGEEGREADRLRRLEHTARKFLALTLSGFLVAGLLRSGSVPTFLLFYTLTAAKSVISAPSMENVVANLAYCYGRIEEYRWKVVARVVIAERDEVMAWALRDCPDLRRHSTVVAVVGAAHLEGIRRLWGSSRPAPSSPTPAEGEASSETPPAACGPLPVDPRSYFGLPPVKGALLQQFSGFMRAYRLPRAEIANVGADGPRVFGTWLEQRRAAEERVNKRLRERRRELVQAAAGPVLSGITVYYVESAKDRTLGGRVAAGDAGRAPPPEPTSRFFLARRDVDAFFNERGLRVADWHVCSVPLDAAYDFYTRRRQVPPAAPGPAPAGPAPRQGQVKLSEAEYLAFCSFESFPVFQVVRAGTGDNALVQPETQRQVWFTSPERAQLAIRRAIKSAGPSSYSGPGRANEPVEGQRRAWETSGADSMIIRARSLGEMLRVIEESVSAGVEPGVFLLE